MPDPNSALLHQLLNSLTVILGECELLQDEACVEANKRLAIIRERAAHMTQIICQAQGQPVPPPRQGFVRTILRAATGR